MLVDQAVFLIALISSCYAIVHFTDSIILDEFDLAVEQFDVDLCAATSCKIYVSTPKKASKTLENIFIGDKSLSDIARNLNKYSKLKTAYVSATGLTIVNRNSDYGCGPVVVYIVAERADFYNTALVYEPSSPSSSAKLAGSVPVTVLSVEPFRVAGTVNKEQLQGPLFTTGFDNVRQNSNKCTSAIDFRSEASFSYYFNGPIVTFYSESEADVDLYLGTFQSSFFQLDTPAFFSSPGYIGCGNGEVYRSSLYNKKSEFSIFSKKKKPIYLNAYLNTVDPVQLEINYHKKMNLIGSIATSDWSQSLQLEGQSVDVTFEPTHETSSFLIKFSSDPFPTGTTANPDKRGEENTTIAFEATTESPFSTNPPSSTIAEISTENAQKTTDGDDSQTSTTTPIPTRKTTPVKTTKAPKTKAPKPTKPPKPTKAPKTTTDPRTTKAHRTPKARRTTTALTVISETTTTIDQYDAKCYQPPVTMPSATTIGQMSTTKPIEERYTTMSPEEWTSSNAATPSTTESHATTSTTVDDLSTTISSTTQKSGHTTDGSSEDDLQTTRRYTRISTTTPIPTQKVTPEKTTKFSKTTTSTTIEPVKTSVSIKADEKKSTTKHVEEITTSSSTSFKYCLSLVVVLLML